MKNILAEENFIAIKNRIKKLNKDSTKQWGVMSLEQMLAHCTVQLQMALGEKPATIQGPSIMRSKLGRWILLSKLPWPRGSLTPKEMNMVKQEVLASEIEAKKGELLDYLERAKREEQLRAHPFFGNLSRQEWSRLIYKHLDHHLRQFGV